MLSPYNLQLSQGLKIFHYHKQNKCANFFLQISQFSNLFLGVMVVFSGLANSPEAAKVYSSDVVQYVKDQINASEEDPKK